MSLVIGRIELPEGSATRQAFGDALEMLGADDRIVVLDGDVNNSTYTNRFAGSFPERFFNVGIAESNLVGVSAGLAAAGKIPVVSSFSIFLLANAFDQIRWASPFPTSTSSSSGPTLAYRWERTGLPRWRSRTLPSPVPSPALR